uniref:DUF1664 domain-containing protein n=1 Tax=Setaria italica TaxID=4555 RepID=K3ZC64_SETIT
IAGSILTTYTKVGDVLSGGLEFVKKHGEGGGGAKSSSGQDTAQLMSQVNILREEIQSLTVRPAMVVTSAAKSGQCLFMVSGNDMHSVVVAGVVGYAYINSCINVQGWKLSDMMFVTKRGLSEACNVVGSQLDQVSDAVVVTKKHLAGRIDLVDSSLDENKQIIEGTRDQVAVINMDLSAFQEDLQSVNLVVQTLDQTVDGIHHLCEFTRKLEPAKNGN